MSHATDAGEAPVRAEVSSYQKIVERLHALPEEFNPAIRLDYELNLLEATGRLTLMMLIAKRGEIEFVAELGSTEIKRVGETIKALDRLPATARLDAPPFGF
jgi:hypothetical protein